MKICIFDLDANYLFNLKAKLQPLCPEIEIAIFSNEADLGKAIINKDIALIINAGYISEKLYLEIISYNIEILQLTTDHHNGFLAELNPCLSYNLQKFSPPERLATYLNTRFKSHVDSFSPQGMIELFLCINLNDDFIKMLSNFRANLRSQGLKLYHLPLSNVWSRPKFGLIDEVEMMVSDNKKLNNGHLDLNKIHFDILEKFWHYHKMINANLNDTDSSLTDSSNSISPTNIKINRAQDDLWQELNSDEFYLKGLLHPIDAMNLNTKDLSDTCQLFKKFLSINPNPTLGILHLDISQLAGFKSVSKFITKVHFVSTNSAAKDEIILEVLRLCLLQDNPQLKFLCHNRLSA